MQQRIGVIIYSGKVLRNQLNGKTMIILARYYSSLQGNRMTCAKRNAGVIIIILTHLAGVWVVQLRDLPCIIIIIILSFTAAETSP